MKCSVMAKKSPLVFGFLALALIGFSACQNNVMDRWWDTHESNAVSTVYYEVDFQANEGLPVPGIQHIAGGERVQKVQPMTREGYAFFGWYTDNGVDTGVWNNEWDFAEGSVTEDMILHARWVSTSSPPAGIEIYTVTFDAEGGNPEPESQSVPAGAKVSEPAAIRKSDPHQDNWYGFGGWFEDDGTPWNFASRRVYENTTLYAKWEDPSPALCTVIFEPYGGSPLPRTQDLIEGTRLVEPFAMNKDGYGFGGWYTDEAFTNKWDFNAPVTGSMTLFAHWITTYYTVTFDADGGFPAPRLQEIAHGTAAAKPPAMQKSGMGFAGWYTDKAFTDTDHWNFDDPVTADMNLYAKWVPAQHTLRFNLKLHPEIEESPGGSGHGFPVPPNQNIADGIRFLEPDFIPTGGANWAFYGWFYTPLSEAVFNAGIDKEKRDTLKPWNFDWTVSIEDNSLRINNEENELISLTDSGAEDGNDYFTLWARWVRTDLDDDMVWVPKGSFMMGATGSGTQPVRKITFSKGFYIGRFPVTQGLYAEINPTHVNHFKDDRRPVEKVSWDNAVVFCNDLSAARTSKNVNVTRNAPPLSDFTFVTSITLTPVYGTDNAPNWEANGYRLPTEAEWEYAARGGNGSPGNFNFAGSNDADEVAWFNTNSGGMTHTVGSKLPNGLGLYDMSGNVSEWCWDWFAPYSNLTADLLDPRGPATGTTRVRRGGGWSNAVNNVRSVVRNNSDPTQAEYVNSFRLVRYAGEDEIY